MTAQRIDVPSIVFDWERALPFWAWTILPYWSIDLLYGLSLFACSSRRELDTHAKRLLTAQVIAVAFFLRHAAALFVCSACGRRRLWGAMFAALAQFDKPFNQLPSLHLALAAILWALYARKLSGVARAAMTTWFVLIGASVLTTYQHHFVDIPTGLLLGLLCMWAWPFADEGDGRSIAAHWHWTRDRRRLRLAALYASSAIALAALAFDGRRLVAVVARGSACRCCWSRWPTPRSASAHSRRVPTAGVSVASRWLFAPYRAGAWINSRAWTLARPAAGGSRRRRVPGPSADRARTCAARRQPAWSI